jgi:hypothetical protein
MFAAPSTVAVRPYCDKSLCAYTAVYRGAAGVRNAVTSSHLDPLTVVIRDAAAPLTPGLDCVAVDANTARCAAPERLDLELRLGDGDDVASLDTGLALGGPGDDRISGVNVRLVGGPGADDLSATVAGTFVDADGARASRDRYRGGSSGGDAVDYAGRHAGIRVDLRAGRAGEDVLSGIENAYGGDGADVLIGTDGPNDLAGTGRDRLVGRGGDDTLNMYGHGRVDAGAGDDKITLNARGARVRCGTGHDFVDDVSSDDLRDCESLAFSRAWELDARLHRRRSRFLTNLGCSCRRASYVARAGRVVVAEARGHPHSLRLNARGRALLRARGTLRIAVRIREVTETSVDVTHFTTLLQRM